MARELQYQGLAELPVIIEDNSRYSSEYFQITKFPELLTAGKNLFRFKGSDKFIEESDVLIEVLDSNGQPIYYEADLDLESTEQSVIVSIYVDEETPPGSGEIILCGYTTTTGSLSYTEDDFQPNIRWRQPIDIDSSKQNVTEVIFNTLPNVLINTSSVVDNYTITNYQGNDLIKSASIYNFTYDYRNGNEPVIYGSVNTNDIATLDVLGGAIFEVTRSKFSGNPRPDNNLTLTTQTLSASIIDYISTGSTIIFTVEYPFESNIQGTTQTHTFINGTGTTGSLYFEQTASANSSENTYTIISASFNGLAPQVGNITKIRTFYKSVGVGEYVLASETDISDQSTEFGYTPDSASIIVPLPTIQRNDKFDLKFQFLNFADAVSKQVLYVKDVGMPGGNVYIGGDDNLITGSVYVAGQTGTGVSIEGSTAGAFIRSVGYEGFQNVVANGATGQPGFIMYSGSVATMLNSTQTENYRGIGLELTAHSESYLRYTTSGSGLLDIRTNKFFLGSSQQYIVGADGLIQISSSNFFLSSSGDVIMAGTITATAGTIGGFSITNTAISSSNNSLILRGNNGQITGSSVLFNGGTVGGFTIDSSKITGTNIIIDSAGSIQTADYASDSKGWKISATDNGFAEFENIKVRGTLKTAVFEKETVNAVGGQLYVANSTTLTGSEATTSIPQLAYLKFGGYSGSNAIQNIAGAANTYLTLASLVTASIANLPTSTQAFKPLGGTGLFIASGSKSAASSNNTSVASLSGVITDTSASYTIMAWVRPDFRSYISTTPTGSILEKSGSASTNGPFFLGFRIASANTASLTYTNGNGSTAGTTVTPAIGTNALLTDTWTHVALTAYVNGALYARIPYVNGVAGALSNTSIFPASNTSPINIGVGRTFTERFPGYIADVRIYNVSMSAAEIAVIYSGSYFTSSIDASTVSLQADNVTGFVNGEILSAKKVSNTGFATEYFQVRDTMRLNPSSDTDFSGILYVTRSYGNGLSGDSGSLGNSPSNAQSYEPSQVIVSTGKLGTGFIRINANPNDQATPYIDIVERTGSGIYDVALKARLGDLSGLANSSYVFGNSNPGFGLATDNVFLQGGIIANTGSIGGINMQSSKLFTGTGTFNNSNTGFYLDSNGQLSLKDKLSWNGTTLTISGTLNATDGKIGGFAVTTDAITGSGFYLSGSATGNGFFISASNFNVKANGDVTASSALFSGSVNVTGNINARTGNIGGFNITANAITGSGFLLSGSATGDQFFISSSNFNVKANGNVTGSNVLFNGGRIASFTLSNDALTAGSTFFISSSVGATLASAFFISSSRFNVRQDGTITGSNVLFNGGTIASFTLSNDALTGGSAFFISSSVSGTPSTAFFISSSRFNVRQDGTITGSNVLFTGGTIGSFTLSNDAFSNGSNFFISSSYNSANPSGSFFISSSRFNVRQDGTVSGSNVFFNGGRIGSFTLSNDALAAGTTFFISSSVSGTPATAFFISSSRFNVKQDGTVTGSNVLFNGGTIGGFTLSSTQLSSTDFLIDSSTGEIELGATGFATGDGIYLSKALTNNFRVGDSVGSRMQFDGTNLEIYNSSNAKLVSIGGTNTIAGFTLSDSTLSNGTNFFISGAATTTGFFISSSRFNVKGNGDVTGSNVLFNGGKIASFTLSNDALTAGTTFFISSSLGGTPASAFFISSSRFNVRQDGTISGSNVFFNGGKIAGFTLSNDTLSNGTNFFLSGSATGDQFFISASNFNVKGNGNVTASNALFTGVALADIIRDKTVVITAANSGSYLRTADFGNISTKTGYRVFLDGTYGGEEVRRVRVACDLLWPIGDFQLPNLSSTAKMEVVLENGVAGNQIYDVFTPTKVTVSDPATITLASNDVLTFVAANANATDWFCIAGNLQPFANFTYKRGVIVTGSLVITGSVTLNNTRIDNDWSSYTPSWTSDGTQPVLNNGTLTGKYKQIGKTVFVRVKLLIGSTTTTGTGTWYFSLPVNAAAADAIIMPATLLDNTVAWYQATVNGVYGNFTDKTALIHDTAGSGSVSVTNSTPFTWGSTDSLQFNGSYEAD
jgi:hypothetical protein